TDSVTIQVTGTSFHATYLQSDSNVSSSCSSCSHGLVSEIPQGGDICTGFQTGKNGTDCVWYGLKSEWEGRTFFANATQGANVDVEMRDGCDPRSSQHIQFYRHNGIERD